MARLAEEVVRGSLWIRPEGSAAIALEHAARSIHERYGGPGAWPHITLARGIEGSPRAIERTLEALAAQLAPFTVRLDGIGWHQDYWRCLFVHVERSRELLDAHRAAREAFGLRPQGDYQPHISLLYGEFAADRKLQMAVELGSRLADLSFGAGTVQFVNATATTPVEQWRTLYEQPLVHRRRAERPATRGRAGLA